MADNDGGRRGASLGRVIALVEIAGIAGLAADPAAANVAQQREVLGARVAAVRQALSSAGARVPSALVAQASNWNNWPKWSKWSNWANQ